MRMHISKSKKEVFTVKERGTLQVHYLLLSTDWLSVLLLYPET